MFEHLDLLSMLLIMLVNDAKYKNKKIQIDQREKSHFCTSSSLSRFLSTCISYNFSIADSVVKLFRIIASVISCINRTYCKRSCLNKISFY